MLKILLVGYGNMGKAILDGLLASKDYADSEFYVLHRSKKPDHNSRLQAAESLSELGLKDKPDIVILATKPQDAAQTLEALRQFDGTTIISIMAGKTLAWMAGYFPHSPIIRTMPNLPATIGMGVTGATANHLVNKACRQNIENLLKATGQVIWVDSDDAIDKVAAVSGSGPAYRFALEEEILAKNLDHSSALPQFKKSFLVAAKDLGFSEIIAKKLIESTIQGAEALMKSSPQTPAELRQAVTSKGGTTAAALAHMLGHLADENSDEIMCLGLKAAYERAQILSQS